MARGISLHIGLNSVDPEQYQGWSGDLNACEADAHDMDAIASAAGFSSRLLLTAEATSDAVLDALEGAAAELTSGDTLLLTYSGHGGQVPDTDGDEEDGMDETWVLFDRQVLDDELRAAYRAFAPGVRVAVTSDSCHSGSVTRMGPPRAAGEAPSGPVAQPPTSPGARSKAMPPAVAQRDFLRRSDLYEARASRQAEAGEPAACVALISGCQDNQLSLDGTYNGLFTATLLTVWNGGQFRGGYGRLRNRIAAKMPDTQTPRFSVLGPTDEDFLTGQTFTI